MNNNKKVHLTIVFGRWQVDTSTDEKGNDLRPVEFKTDINKKTGKEYITATKIPMTLVPIGTQSMVISAEALRQPAEGVHTKNLELYNVKAIAACCRMSAPILVI